MDISVTVIQVAEDSKMVQHSCPLQSLAYRVKSPEMTNRIPTYVCTH